MVPRDGLYMLCTCGVTRHPRLWDGNRLIHNLNFFLYILLPQRPKQSLSSSLLPGAPPVILHGIPNCCHPSPGGLCRSKKLAFNGRPRMVGRKSPRQLLRKQGWGTEGAQAKLEGGFVVVMFLLTA